MDRRQFIEVLGTSIAAAQMPAAATAPSHAVHKGEHPNFLFMIADDMTFRTIRALNNPEIHTPNLDRLVARGCAFTHCFQQGSWMGAVCAPSRTMLNSGLSAFHARDAALRLPSYQPRDIEQAHNKPQSGKPGIIPHVALEPSLGDYPLWLQSFRAAGYQTYLCGKWHVDDVSMQRSFTELGPDGPGMYRSTDTNGAAYNRPHADGSDTWNAADRSQHGVWLDTSVIEPWKPKRIQHASEFYADHVCDYLLNKAAKRRDPFFVYLGWNAPHDPRQAPQEFLDLYPVEGIEIPESFLPEHPFDEGDHYIRDEQLAPFPRTAHAVQVHRREYYAMISHMDAQIGRIFDALERSGKAEHTYVIMTADHGLAIGEHGLMGKQNNYECSMRIPCIIAGPGIPAGRRVDELVYQHSMFATTCELAGLALPPHVEFASLVPLLKGGAEPLNEAVFGYYKSYQRSIRTKTHKLIVYPEAKRVQVFDIANDPYETRDLSNDPSMAGKKKELYELLKRHQRQLDDDLDLDAAMKGIL